MADQDFESITDDFGSDEDASNNDVTGDDDISAIYTELVENTELTLCSNNQYGTANKLSNSQFMRFDAATSKNYSFTVSPVTGSFGNGQALLSIYKQGGLITAQQAFSSGANLTVNRSLSGQHVVALAHVDNIDGGTDLGRRCFSVMVN